MGPLGQWRWVSAGAVRASSADRWARGAGREGDARAKRGSCLGQSREGKERGVGPGEGEEGVGRGKGWAAGLSWVWVALGWFSSLGFWAGLQGFGLGSHV